MSNYFIKPYYYDNSALKDKFSRDKRPCIKVQSNAFQESINEEYVDILIIEEFHVLRINKICITLRKPNAGRIRIKIDVK